ncbi:hypothetical protein QCA50_011924 [Cerrena zonata]|uniref:Uncharacterized protein n=1 Tax=Cerrena zonata TaxID=2478898 RepID=A0AAW0FY21_9APHY
MANSISTACTPLKQEYDKCFNAWFEGYLEPAVAATPEQRSTHSQEKAAEYEQKCGQIWTQYKQCVANAVKDKGLDTLLDQARKENPLKEPPPIPKSENS